MTRSSRQFDKMMKKTEANNHYRQWRDDYYSTTPTAKSGWKFWKREK